MKLRYRERNNLRLFSPQASTASGTTNGPTCTSYSQAGPALAFPYNTGSYESMTDVVTPRYKELSARGDIINSPMSRFRTSNTVEIGTASYYIPYAPATPANVKKCAHSYTQTMTNYTGGLNRVGSPLKATVSSKIDRGRLVDLASTDAAANIDDPIFDGLVFVAELNETIRFLREPLSTWNKYLRDLKKFKNRKKSQRDRALIQFMGDSWLALRYGVRPLFYDMVKAVEAIDNVVSGDKPTRHTARGFSSDTANSTVTEVLYTNGVGWTVSTTSDSRVVVRCGILYEMFRDPDTFGIRFERIPEAAWEAMRFSFVIDWFVNIGPFIGAITPKGGIRQLASWTTTKSEVTSQRLIRWTHGGTLATAYGDTTREITGDGLSREMATFNGTTREPGISVGLNFKTSFFKGLTGAGRAVDLVAIGRQLLLSH